MKRAILVIDNYDSFTYNLVHILRVLGHQPDIYRNDKIAVEEVAKYDKILLSPGPGVPEEAGIMKQVISHYGATKSILGVCLGHQGIGEVYGASLFNIPQVLHGVTSRVNVLDSNELLFKNIPRHFRATHYHSWVISPETIGNELEVTAVNADGLVMAIRHHQWDVRGVQFHPESVMTEFGSQ
ncbi:MAG: aminodeoxychorismate/anthranilate synthase component II, partial [Cyclobacteriaceae bacterium]|nr:aminodeoxychorismate/anthranilate synthase component II [Cyclobacteriaceae bacterium]